MKSKRFLIVTISVTLFTVFIMLNSCTKEKVENMIQNANPKSSGIISGARGGGEPGGPAIQLNFDYIGKYFLDFSTSRAFDSINDLLLHKDKAFLDEWEKQFHGFLSMRTFFENGTGQNTEGILIPAQSLATIVNHRGIVEIEDTIYIHINQDTIVGITDGDKSTIGKILGGVPLSSLNNIRINPIINSCSGRASCAVNFPYPNQKTYMVGQLYNRIAVYSLTNQHAILSMVTSVWTRKKFGIITLTLLAPPIYHLTQNTDGFYTVRDATCTNILFKSANQYIVNGSNMNFFYYELDNLNALKYRIDTGDPITLFVDHGARNIPAGQYAGCETVIVP